MNVKDTADRLHALREIDRTANVLKLWNQTSAPQKVRLLLKSGVAHLDRGDLDRVVGCRLGQQGRVFDHGLRLHEQLVESGNRIKRLRRQRLALQVLGPDVLTLPPRQ